MKTTKEFINEMSALFADSNYYVKTFDTFLSDISDEQTEWMYHQLHLLLCMINPKQDDMSMEVYLAMAQMYNDDIATIRNWYKKNRK